jgi:hypothetical protein
MAILKFDNLEENSERYTMGVVLKSYEKETLEIDLTLSKNSG